MPRRPRALAVSAAAIASLALWATAASAAVVSSGPLAAQVQSDPWHLSLTDQSGAPA